MWSSHFLSGERYKYFYSKNIYTLYIYFRTGLCIIFFFLRQWLTYVFVHKYQIFLKCLFSSINTNIIYPTLDIFHFPLLNDLQPLLFRKLKVKSEVHFRGKFSRRRQKVALWKSVCGVESAIKPKGDYLSRADKHWEVLKVTAGVGTGWSRNWLRWREPWDRRVEGPACLHSSLPGTQLVLNICSIYVQLPQEQITLILPRSHHLVF